MGCAAGKAIQAHVLDAGLLRAATRVGCYVHCDKLREVHTDRLLAALLDGGDRAATWRCYVPLIKEEAALMHMLHIGARPVRLPRRQGTTGRQRASRRITRGGLGMCENGRGWRGTVQRARATCGQ